MDEPMRRSLPTDKRAECLLPSWGIPLATGSDSNTTSTRFDEAKCRNVLVRYCAHIPRNYQYRDGIRLVFLVLRDHLGDEHLGQAGGVLYELIEVDCQHSDDVGAAFQRWRHAHMNRHTDLELPHVPHLTTITSAIIPTAFLVQWRKDHLSRYSTRLSDYSAAEGRNCIHFGTIQNRKSWVIEYTMFISSRDGGTRPFHRIKAKEFHEMQWNEELGHGGRLVGEKSIDLPDTSLSGETNGLSTARHSSASTPPRLSVFKRTNSFRGIIDKARHIMTGTAHSPDRGNWLPRMPNWGTTTSLRDLLESESALRVSDWEIPNAIFARKFGLLVDSHSLPTSIKELPVAEDKAIGLGVNSSVRGPIYPWRFQGPLTPQLWFDSGLDYRWRRKRS